MINKDELVDYNKKIEYEDLSKEELVKLIKLQDTFNEVHNEILNLKDKVINLMAIQLSNRPLLIFKGNGKLEVLEEPKKIVEYFYNKADEEIQKNKAI